MLEGIPVEKLGEARESIVKQLEEPFDSELTPMQLQRRKAYRHAVSIGAVGGQKELIGRMRR